MGYTVVNQFADLHDNGYVYQPGDKFPRDGFSVNSKRLSELAGEKNKLKKALIEEDVSEEEIIDESNDAPSKAKINRSNVATLQYMAQSVGIDTDGKSGGELKKALIEYWGL